MVKTMASVVEAMVKGLRYRESTVSLLHNMNIYYVRVVYRMARNLF